MKCEICKREYKNFKSLGVHISRTHKISTKEYYDKFLKKENEGICSECGIEKETTFTDIRNGYQKYCTHKCSNSSKEKQEKSKQTNLERCGAKYPSQSEETRKKINQTCLKNYGVKYPFQNKEIREKYKQTCLEHFGVENPLQNKEVKDKKIQTCLRKYGVEYPSQTQEFKERNSEVMKNGKSVYIQSFIRNPSKPQVKLYELVKSLHDETFLNFPSKGKSGKHFSLDIAIPNLMIDVEYDGSYFHDPEKDQKRQKDLEEAGWKFLRYKDYIPSLQELKENLESII